MNFHEPVSWSAHAECVCTHVSDTCFFVYVSAEALRLQSEALWSYRGRRPAQLEELMEDLVVWSRAPAAQHQQEHLQGAVVWLQLISVDDRDSLSSKTSATL